MYIITLRDSHSLTFPDFKRVNAIVPELFWEDDDGRDKFPAATGRGYILNQFANPKRMTAHRKAVEQSARDEGYTLKQEHDAFNKRHGWRLEVVRELCREATEAERQRKIAMRRRAGEKVEEIIRHLRAHSYNHPGGPSHTPEGQLADYIEKGGP